MTKGAPNEENYVGEHRSGLELLREEKRAYKLYCKDPDVWTKSRPIPVKVTASHLALYTGLFSIWNDSYWPKLITPAVKTILDQSLLSEETYRKCLPDLRALGILTYIPSQVKNQSITIRMQPLYQENSDASNENIKQMYPENKTPSGLKTRSYINPQKLSKNNKKNINDFFEGLENRTTIIE